jgi:hypothetical protein
VTFAERIGGVLVSPRRTLAEAVTGPPHGLRDVMILLAFRVVAGETPALAKAVAEVPGLGLAAAMRGVLHALLAVAPDVLGILVASILMSLCAGKAAVRGRELDVAAYAWVPYLAVTLFAALAATAVGRPPGPTVEALVQIAAVGWSALVWGLGLAALRRAPREQAPAT